MKKLIALDVDGTLVNSKKIMTDKTKDTLIRAIEMGHELMIVSGRQTAGLISLAKRLKFDRLGGLLSSFNGGMLYDFKKEKILANHPMDIRLAREILDFSKDLNLELMIPYDGYIITDKDDHPYTKRESKILEVEIKLIKDIRENLDFAPNKFLFAQDPDKIDGPIKKLREKFIEKTEQVKSARFYYEIMPKGLSKGRALVEAANLLDIPVEDTIAFGDEMNDISMIKAAGVGVAMANAVDPVKSVADYITKSNDEDGIAYFLEKHIL